MTRFIVTRLKPKCYYPGQIMPKLRFHYPLFYNRFYTQSNSADYTKSCYVHVHVHTCVKYTWTHSWSSIECNFHIIYYNEPSWLCATYRTMHFNLHALMFISSSSQTDSYYVIKCTFLLDTITVCGFHIDRIFSLVALQ